MRVLVCGSRDWTDEVVVERALNGLNLSVLIHGAARGADMLANDIVSRWVEAAIDSYPANWKKHGKAAGPIRNQQMLDEGKPDLVLAFWKNKSRGTADMIRRARKAGVAVRVIEG